MIKATKAKSPNPRAKPDRLGSNRANKEHSIDNPKAATPIKSKMKAAWAQALIAPFCLTTAGGSVILKEELTLVSMSLSKLSTISMVKRDFGFEQ
ncbi:hypothetical protein WICPIJ_005408 [Wickerhamomyces pijperi]|uniref:Uncharacterized protein n=1 Tax=Wickerhamomyces pijperi TaxID=599730 RepID=A0A9P8TLV6_WICPI|nr:hypothetical protein WICPIJ_005408 [Wickerhamomyces pijperi]